MVVVITARDAHLSNQVHIYIYKFIHICTHVTDGLPHHVPGPEIVTRDDNASHVHAHLDRLGVDPANAKLQLLGGAS